MLKGVKQLYHGNLRLDAFIFQDIFFHGALGRGFVIIWTSVFFREPMKGAKGLLAFTFARYGFYQL